jgi:predicted  nucleic acid-binding Zn-ribbon protein
MRTLGSLVLSACVVLFSGCAYLTTYNKQIDLDGGSVSMDVKQRVIFSQKRIVKGINNAPDKVEKMVVCAEPSPDALTVLGVSGNLNLTDGDKAAGAAAGLAESGAFVGLRTQSIQLLRDAMYRLCEGYASGAVGESDFAAMQRRYQSTMMGLIAIEQLTRPVVAGQALLTSAAGAQSGASAGDAAVDKAQQRIDAAKAALLTTQGELDKAQTRAEKAQSMRAEITDKIAAERKKKPEDQDAAALTALKDQLSTAMKEVEDSRLALADARRRNEASEEAVRSANGALRAAEARVSASASAGGSLSAVAASAAQSAEHLTKGVVQIVQEINTSYTKDACLALLSDLVKTPETLKALITQEPRQPTKPSAGVETSVDARISVLFRSLQTCEQILAAEQRRVESIEQMRAPAFQK